MLCTILNGNSPGTTEKIFQSKTELYDVFVDSQNITTHSSYLEPLLKPNLADEQRFQHLNTIRCEIKIQLMILYYCILKRSDHFISFGGARNSQSVDDELGLARYELNDKQFLIELALA